MPDTYFEKLEATEYGASKKYVESYPELDLASEWDTIRASMGDLDAQEMYDLGYAM